MKPDSGELQRVLDSAAEAGVDISPARASMLRAYADMLREPGSGLSRGDRTWRAVVAHIEDSLSAALLPGLDWGGSRVIDIGTGPGLPGIPLAVLYCPDAHFTLLDRSARRRGFLRRTLAELGFPPENPQILTADAVELAQEGMEWELAVARALARPPQAVGMLSGLLVRGGTGILWLGDSDLEAITEVRNGSLVGIEVETFRPKSLETRGGLVIIRKRAKHV